MAEPTTTERLAWPLQLAADGRLAVVEQDSDEDIEQCITAIVHHRVGDRPDIPELGVPDLAFTEQPIETDALVEIVERHEPRAAVIARGKSLSDFIAEVTLQWRDQPQQDEFGDT